MRCAQHIVRLWRVESGGAVELAEMGGGRGKVRWDGQRTQHTVTVQLEGVADDGRAFASQTDRRRGTE